MAKKTTGKTRKAAEPLRSFDVYEQEDGALVVLPAGDEPETDDEPIWSGEAVDERDAIAEARHSHKDFADAPAANPMHDPNLPNRVREQAEAETNARLGITSPTQKGKTKQSAKRGAKKKSAAKRKSTKKSSRRY